ncbi:cell division protein FtsZ [Cohaesibacter sp. CAU 1516]|uniref:cell division protein FtsZ n=1 Tax=Cohaesibacter sp. CAU 1516 TaxID=2576038 RepID=UPI0010FD17F5|nr:cell division protein FtsZ [Cohaesibacter sp. CAU 1516]TLP48447.1 cell division protein FtsZ [Cohaesibacter sp. CAU 1516]
MTINLKMPDITELKPRITVFGVGGAGGNAVNNMIETGLDGVDFVVANTDAQALTLSKAERIIQMGIAVTEGLGAGSQPEVGRAAAEEVIDEINDHLNGSHMVFITAGMGGGTGTGAAPVIARTARDQGILTVGVVTKPFHFEGQRRMRLAETGIEDLQKNVDTLIVIPNQNLFRIANEKTTFADAFSMADEVLYSGVACITDLMVKEGLINLDFADVRSVMRAMGKAMMGTGEASGENRALAAAEAAIANPLLDDISMKGAQGLLISITGGQDLTLFEVDEAATRIREEVDEDANIILGATFDENMDGMIRVSVVATGIDQVLYEQVVPADQRMRELSERLRTVAAPTGEAEAEQAVSQPAEPVAFEEEAAAAVAEAVETVERQMELPQATFAQPSVQDPAVSIAPFTPQAASEPVVEEEYEAPRVAVEERPVVAEQPFIPPTAEVPENLHRQMPNVDELPPIIQRELEALRNGENLNHHDDDSRPMSLLKRLAAVGLGRRDDEPDMAQPSAPVQQQPAYQPVQQDLPVMPTMNAPAAPQAPMSAQPQMAAQDSPLNEFAPRPQRPAQHGMYQPQQGQLDAQGRAIPAAPMQPQGISEEDQVEIPAFLRRQVR